MNPKSRREAGQIAATRPCAVVRWSGAAMKRAPSVRKGPKLSGADHLLRCWLEAYSDAPALLAERKQRDTHREQCRRARFRNGRTGRITRAGSQSPARKSRLGTICITLCINRRPVIDWARGRGETTINRPPGGAGDTRQRDGDRRRCGEHGTSERYRRANGRSARGARTTQSRHRGFPSRSVPWRAADGF